MASTRRLAAILAADVAGYSRLMGEDEEGTLAELKAVRRELSDPKVKEHRGRIVKTTGDGLLIEFASVVDAVRCAVEVQRAMAERNAEVPPDRRIELPSFTYKGRAIDLTQVGRELGVRYILEGSVRKAGNRVRITAQLIDAANSAHLWADRFDGSLEDVFELQDKVALNVAAVIEPTLQAAEIRRSAARPTNDLTAYDLYLRALAPIRSGEWERERYLQGLDLLGQAI